MKLLLLLLIAPLSFYGQTTTQADIIRWQQQAAKVTITRDNWGIPHVYGKTDADAVFGLMYAQCEDDFKRVEINYIEKLGRLAEVKGISELYNDLYLKMVIDSATAIDDYNKSPAWLKQLLNAFADGINYYLYKNPATKPVLLHRFQPWYPLLWTDGSIGAISTGVVTATDVENLYTGNNKEIGLADRKYQEVTSGSNGFAIAPSKTVDGNALLYINPHVTFYFRPEVEMESEEGLHAYGAVTWGQFFIYQGFNEFCGWMHTSNNVDVADNYVEKITTKADGLYYEYDNAFKKVNQQKLILHYKDGEAMQSKTFNILSTGHGPIMAKIKDQYISVKSVNRSVDGLIQSWQRTKAKSFDEYKKIMSLRANASNNTVYADAAGNIAYWHGNFIPKRDIRYKWSQPQDGSTSKTEWQGLHELDEMVHVYNPSTGWIQNCNSTPFTVSGDASPKKQNYPPYMAPDGENFRGLNAVRIFSKDSAFTMNKMIADGYDTYLSSFEMLIPPLIKAFDETIHPGDSLFALLAEPINVLRKWNYYAGEQSVATSLAIHWAEMLPAALKVVYVDEGEDDQVTTTKKFIANAKPSDLVDPFIKAITKLKETNGTWNIAWGEINRYQRISGDIDQPFNDAQVSESVAFTSSTWGMIPAYNSRYFAGTNKRYGVSGNSFICAVEFGKKIKAKSLLAGGESGNIKSKHFKDQLKMYTKGQFKEVLFYKEDVLKHAERTYHP